MFTLGVFTDEVSQDFEKALDFAVGFGCTHVEIRSAWDIKQPQDFSASQVERMKALLADRGLSVVGIASPFYKCALDDPRERSRHIEILRESIALARELGTDLVRGFAFWRVEGVDAAWPRIVGAFAEPIRIVEAEGITLGLENEPATCLLDARYQERLLHDLGSPRVKAIWDPGNDAYAGAPEPPYPAGYERVRNRIVHVHVKDATHDPARRQGAFVPVGEGDVDWRGQLRRLDEDGYTGCVSLETHWRPTKQLDEAHGGSARRRGLFRGGGRGQRHLHEGSQGDAGRPDVQDDPTVIRLAPPPRVEGWNQRPRTVQMSSSSSTGRLSSSGASGL